MSHSVSNSQPSSPSPPSFSPAFAPSFSSAFGAGTTWTGGAGAAPGPGTGTTCGRHGRIFATRGSVPAPPAAGGWAARAPPDPASATATPSIPMKPIARSPCRGPPFRDYAASWFIVGCLYSCQKSRGLPGGSPRRGLRWIAAEGAALPAVCVAQERGDIQVAALGGRRGGRGAGHGRGGAGRGSRGGAHRDRKSTRLNSSHLGISYAV